MASTAKVGSRHENCPNTNTMVRQQREIAASWSKSDWDVRNGCYLNTVMSINWRASLVPAAAVIPAPVVYTNIVAVKTLVVIEGECGAVTGPSCYGFIFS